MSANKTQPTSVSVRLFLDGIEDTQNEMTVGQFTI